jgi:hypothetical protein
MRQQRNRIGALWVSSLEEPAPKRPSSSANADDQLQERANAMTGRETTIVAGIEIPSTDPVFLAVLRPFTSTIYMR